jgi:hypoxanthine phosphoribosyltransferase
MIKLGTFTAHSGEALPWKIECDMIPDDWIHTFAAMIAKKFRFRRVLHIPTGGTRLAQALEDYKTPDGSILLVDDVLTTGRSMIEARDRLREDLEVEGVVLVARTVIIPDWIYPIFTLNVPFQK